MQSEIDWSLGSGSTSSAANPTVAKAEHMEEDIDEAWEAEATAAIAAAEAKAHAMGPPPTPSPKKPNNSAMQTPPKSEGEFGKENQKQDLPA